MPRHYLSLIFLFFITHIYSQDYITTWKTDIPGLTENNQILITTYTGESYDYDIDWGDGNTDTNVPGDITHTYAQPGTYQISISGTFPGILFAKSSGSDRNKLLEINQWGNIQWRSFEGAYSGAQNLQIVATDLPDLSQVSNFRRAFYGCTNMVGHSSMNQWDMSNAVSLISMFANTSAFDTYIGDWDLSNVEEIYSMFQYATAFNQDIGNWRFPKVTGLTWMFDGAIRFNGDISNWELVNIVGLGMMFQNAQTFNQDISGWDVGNVTNMEYMFSGATSFSQDITGWNVSNVRSMVGMFTDAQSFDNNLGSWDMQSVISLAWMFSESKLSSENYDATLNGWAQLPNLQTGIEFDAGFSQYCDGVAAREVLVNNFGWEIEDDGLSCHPPLSIKDVFLVDAVEDEILFALNDNAQINRQSLANQLVNFEVLTTDDVGSVAIELMDTQNISTTSNVAPYTLFGNNGSDYLGNTLPSGTYTLIVTPYSEDNQTGTAGNPFVLNFKILDDPAKSFITTWRIDSPGYVTIRTIPGEHYYYTIQWSNGLTAGGVSGNTTRYFDEPGTYTITISGRFPGIVMEGNEHAQNLISIDQWGDMDWASMEGAFTGCSNLEILATDVPDLSNVESMARMFQGCSSLNGASNMSSWDVGNVTNMSNTFKNAALFNQDVTGWDVSNVSNMAGMFEGANGMNQNLAGWDISQVLDMGNMFDQSALSNENYEAMLTAWNQLPSLQNGVRLGAQQNNYCASADIRQNLISTRGWNIMDGGLATNCAIDGEMPFLTTWKTDNRGSSANNQITIYTSSIYEGYDYSVDWGDGTTDTNVQGDITHTFPEPGIYRVAIYGDFLGIYMNNAGSTRLRDDDKLLSVDQWGDIEWEFLHSAFAGCENMELLATDLPDLSKGPSLANMFGYCTNLIGNTSMNLWDLSEVEDLAYMFSNAQSFNQNLDSWDMSKAIYMYNMFEDASVFNQDLSSWNISNVINMTQMFDGSGLSDDNYNQMLMGWASLPSLQQDVQLDASQNRFCDAALARHHIIKNHNWTINDQGRSNGCVVYHPEEVFITTWKTDNPGVSDDNQVRLPLYGSSFSVDWGDGTIETDLNGPTTHTYANPGVYSIAVFGTPYYIRQRGTSNGDLLDDSPKILEINQWGTIKWDSMWSAFDGCVNLDMTAVDVPDLSEVNSLYNLFYNCESLVGNDSFKSWDVSEIGILAQTFAKCGQFNIDISNWDTGSAISMEGLFEGCALFDQDISGWNVSNVQSMTGMFNGATVFNQNIGGWDVANVQRMDLMFSESAAFNQNISNWNVSKVLTMKEMFKLAASFDQDISGWDITNVTDMSQMFYGNQAFNQDLGSWNISQVLNLTGMFSNTGLSTDNYDKTLLGWSNLPFLRSFITFDAGISEYCESAAARQQIIDSFGWNINDAGESPLCNVDTDNDGVFDYKDECPETPPGIYVNEYGCEIIPLDAIKVYALTPSCPDSSDGAIQISTYLTGYFFDVFVEGESNNWQFNDVNSNTNFSIGDLETGTYLVTISIPDSDYQKSYGVSINELGAITGKRSSLEPGAATVSYTVAGSKSYEVLINEQKKNFTFEDAGEQTISLTGLVGQTEVTIKGETDCQGKITDSFFMGSELQVYPTLTSEFVNIATQSNSLKAYLFGIDGRLVKEMVFDQNEKILDVSSMESGIYILRISMEGKDNSVKIIKR